MRILITSVAKKKEAKKLSKKLVKKGLAACVSSFSAKSLYAVNFIARFQGLTGRNFA